MEKTYITEAFKALDVLNEDTFDTDSASLADLKAFLDSEEDDDVIDIIDGEAETEEEVKDSYLGKAILRCCVCDQLVYKDKDKIQVSETQDVVNADEECPICCSVGGFKIIGQVAPYAETEVTVDDKESTEDADVEVAVDDKVVDECNVKNTRAGIKKASKELSEAYVIDTWGQVDEDPRDFAKEYNLTCKIIDRNKDETTFKFIGRKEDLERAKDDGYFYCDKCEIVEENLIGDVNLNVPVSGNSVGFLGGTSGDVSNNAEKTESKKRKGLKESKSNNNYGLPEKQGDFDLLVLTHDNLDDQGLDEETMSDMYGDTWNRVFVYCDEVGNEGTQVGVENKDGTLDVVGGGRFAEVFDVSEEKFVKRLTDTNFMFGDLVKEAYRKGHSAKTEGKKSCDLKKNEQFEKVEIETDKEKIKIETEPKDDEEVVVPVSDEFKAEIEAETDADEDKVDVDIDEFSEEDFDELGESYLKQTYSNVKGYKTTGVSQEGNSLKLEGIITFNSGKQKRTNFKFEAKDASKTGKVRFIGENAQISRGKKVFTLSGKVKDKKFLSESLTYNYRVNDEKGKSKRLYGTVKHK